MFTMNPCEGEPLPLTLESTFASPDPATACEDLCAGRQRLILTPIDILLLKKRLGLTSTQLLEAHTDKVIDPTSKLPLVAVKPVAAGGPCPWADNSLVCTLADDRPGACRLYPLGCRGLLTDQGVDEQYFSPPSLAPTGAAADLTLAAWLDQQKISPERRDLDRQWLQFILVKSEPDAVPPDGRTQGLFYMVVYDGDKFRRFLFETPFLSAFEVPKPLVETLRTNDLELLTFGYRYLRMIFGIDCTLILYDDVRQMAFPSDPSIANLYVSY